MTGPRDTFGLLAEYDTPQDLLAAARRVTDAGFRHVDAFTPFPVEGLADAMQFRKTRMPLLVLIGGLLGCAGGYWLQWWVSVRAYPLNIGGRPLNSWPAFIPVTFEMTILVASLFAVLGMLALNGLPRPHHPLFAIEGFSRASTDGYFLLVEASDPQFDDGPIRQIFAESHAKEVWHVPTAT